MYRKNIRALEAGVNATVKFVPDAHWVIRDEQSICIRSQFVTLTGIPIGVRNKLKDLGWEVSAFEMCLNTSVTDLDRQNLIHNVTELITLHVPTELKVEIANKLGVREDCMVSDALTLGKTMQLVILCEEAVKNLFRRHQREKAWLLSYENDEAATDKLRIGTDRLHEHD